ncbi:MAG: GGDEF domain-containing protein, partial [Pyrinomonadaceae bacterium]
CYDEVMNTVNLDIHSVDSEKIVVQGKSYKNFDEAVKAVLDFLKQRTGFNLWVFSRKVDSNLIVIESNDNSGLIKSGDTFPWADSICARMVAGEGPCFAPILSEVKAYSEIPLVKQMNIQAYVGVPIFLEQDQKLLGTLCGIDFENKSEIIGKEIPIIEIMASLLGAIFMQEQKIIEQSRAIESLRKEAETDQLTGLLNRRGWETRLSKEEARIKRYGTPVAAMIIDLNDLKKINDTEGHEAGDKLIIKAAECLKSNLRSTDIIARIGGDEFAVLVIEVEEREAKVVFERLLSKFNEQNINVAIGMAKHEPTRPLTETIKEADKAMYLMKSRNRQISP